MRCSAVITAYDPKAVEEAKACYLRDMPEVSYVESKYEALRNADAFYSLKYLIGGFSLLAEVLHSIPCS